MIENESLWKRRWTIIKRIIKLREQEDDYIDKTIVIQVPKTLKGKVNISIKDKYAGTIVITAIMGDTTITKEVLIQTV